MWPGAIAPPVTVPALNNSDLDGLTDHLIEILRREIRHLYEASSRGKLEESSAQDLVRYAKLLHELKELERQKLEDLTDIELEALLKERREAQSTGNSEGT